MFKELISSVQLGTCFYALEICEVSGTYMYYLLEAQKRNNELKILKEAAFETLDFESFQIRKNNPLLVVINTVEVLTKVVEITPGMQEAELLNKAFPNVNPALFYYQIARFNLQAIVTISSRKTVEAWMDKVRQLGLDPADFSLGCAALGCVLEMVDSRGIISSRNHLKIGEEGGLQLLDLPGQKRGSYSNEIQELQISNTAMLGFCALVGWASDFVKESNFNKQSTSLKTAFRYKRMNGLMLKGGLAFLLVVLSLNFLLFYYYHEKVAHLSSSREIGLADSRLLSDLQRSTNSKEKLLEAILSSGNSRASFFLDQIVSEAPPTILLENLNYQPLTKPIKKNTPVLVDQNRLRLQGTTINTMDFFEWVKKIEGLNCISKAEITGFEYVSAKRSQFNLLIDLYDK